MAQQPKSTKLLKKSEAALIAAIEIYNKPDFTYREETFAILALNAWELLLKAKLLDQKNNDVRALYVYEHRQTKTGKQSAKKYLRRNRAGNIHTLGLGAVLSELDKAGLGIPDAVKANIDALTEIRDNAVHFVNASPQLAKQILEVGTGSIKNFLNLAKSWFNHDLSKYNLFLMPLGFVTTPGATALAVSPDEKKLVSYLATLVNNPANTKNPDFHVALEVNLSFTRSTQTTGEAVRITTDPNAPEVQLSEEDNIRKKYPWDYHELTKRLKKRYLDFKANQTYHNYRKPLMKDRRYVRQRYLDPGNPRSARKDFYNPNIQAEFDKHYTRQKR